MHLAGLLLRLKPAFLKATGRLALCPWRAVWTTLDPRTIGVVPPAEKIEVLEDDGDFKKLRFNGTHEAWFPRTAKINAELWNEYLSVFWAHPVNGHYYQKCGTLVKRGDVVIDGGPCEGFFVAQALEAGAAKVVCIEANAVMANALRMTFAREITAGSVIVEHAALGAFLGSAAFGFDAEFPSYGALGETANSKMVKVLTLDSVADQLNLGSIDFIKMDIEGAEFQALEGSFEVLRTKRPKLAITTYHRQFDFMSIKALLIGVGYARVVSSGISEFHQTGQYRPVLLHAF